MKTPKLIHPLGLAIVAGALLQGTLGHADAPIGQYTVTSDTVYDTKTKLTWQRAVASSAMTWANAKSYCTALNLGGSGWRLPSMKELQTIVDKTRSNPAIDPTAFPSTPSDYFWSSSPVAGYADGVWSVDFLSGDSLNFVVGDALRVRCVR
jgi:hypothetical protein